MRELSIDIETFSSVDLKKCGVYKYVESPDFEIMLLAYKYDDGPTHIIDLVGGNYTTSGALQLQKDLVDPSYNFVEGSAPAHHVLPTLQSYLRHNIGKAP